MDKVLAKLAATFLETPSHTNTLEILVVGGVRGAPDRATGLAA